MFLCVSRVPVVGPSLVLVDARDRVLVVRVG